MGKTFSALVVTLLVSVMGIPVAYLIGQRSAQEELYGRYQRELEQVRTEQRQLIAAMQTAAAPAAVADAPQTLDGAPAGTPIAESTFEGAAIGTPYEDVVEKFGREGAPVLTLEDTTGSVTRQYQWDWRQSDGRPGRVLMEFVDGLLIDKQFKD